MVQSDIMNVYIEEVGLREGLQSNKQTLTFEQKINIIDRVLASGIKRVQLGSFINEKKVPQMAGVEELFKYYADRKDCLFSGLVLNRKGLERALECGAKLVNISISASDTHNRENTGKNIDEVIDDLIDMIKTAVDSGIRVRAGVQAAFGCYYEGKVSRERVLAIIEKFVEAEADEIGLSDTAGFATPGMIKDICGDAFKIAYGKTLGLHLHDTFGMGMANVLTAIDSGVSIFDSSVAGMGGCPFMPGAPGNLPTEDVVYMLKSLGYLENIQIDELIIAADIARSTFGADFTGKVSAYSKILTNLKIL